MRKKRSKVWVLGLRGFSCEQKEYWWQMRMQVYQGLKKRRVVKSLWDFAAKLGVAPQELRDVLCFRELKFKTSGAFTKLKMLCRETAPELDWRVFQEPLSGTPKKPFSLLRYGEKLVGIRRFRPEDLVFLGGRMKVYTLRNFGAVLVCCGSMGLLLRYPLGMKIGASLLEKWPDSEDESVSLRVLRKRSVLIEFSKGGKTFGGRLVLPLKGKPLCGNVDWFPSY